MFVYGCPSCGSIHEEFVFGQRDKHVCPNCKNESQKVIDSYYTVSIGLPNGFASLRTPPKKEVIDEL